MRLGPIFPMSSFIHTIIVVTVTGKVDRMVIQRKTTRLFAFFLLAPFGTSPLLLPKQFQNGIPFFFREILQKLSFDGTPAAKRGLVIDPTTAGVVPAKMSQQHQFGVLRAGTIARFEPAFARVGGASFSGMGMLGEFGRRGHSFDVVVVVTAMAMARATARATVMSEGDGYGRGRQQKVTARAMARATARATAMGDINGRQRWATLIGNSKGDSEGDSKGDHDER